MSPFLLGIRHTSDGPPGADVTEDDMTARMKNPAMVLPDVVKGVNTIFKAVHSGGVPEETLELVHLRASQINGCGACVDMGARAATKAGETPERLWSLVAWREAPYYSDAERAALALTEAATRLSDRPGAVTDEIWAEATRHYDERQLEALVLMVAITNFFNRLNTTFRVPAGTSWD
jgi:AhpD family alkylhydroperoxidase